MGSETVIPFDSVSLWKGSADSKVRRLRESAGRALNLAIQGALARKAA